MLRLAKWLVGYVTFTFQGGFCEGFLNACRQHRLAISNIQYRGGTLYADCPAVMYRLLRPLARQNGGRLHLVRRWGLPFKLQPLKGRWGLLVGLVACAALTGYLSGFIWHIEVTGTASLPAEEVQSFLAQNGFHEGVHWRAAEVNYYESLLMASFDECAWVHINRDGTNALVEIGESVAKPPMHTDTAPANLKAAKSGTVVQVTVLSGWQAVREGEGVVKGDLLVSGVYESEAAEENLFAHADGEVLADVEEPFSLTVSRTQQAQVPQPAQEYRSLLFFGLKLPLYFGTPTTNDATVTEDYRYVTLNGQRLPIGTEIMTVTPYTVEERTLSDSELEALAAATAEAEIAAQYRDAEVLSRQLETVLRADNATVSGTLLCRESIGETVPLSRQEEAASP